MALLVLRQGIRVAAIEALVAGGLLALITLVVGASVPDVAAAMLTTWLPALLLATLLQFSRSLTLTLQVSVIVAILIVIVFYVVVSDPLAFWQTILTAMARISQEMGLQEQADFLMSEQALVAKKPTGC